MSTSAKLICENAEFAYVLTGKFNEEFHIVRKSGGLDIDCIGPNREGEDQFIYETPSVRFRFYALIPHTWEQPPSVPMEIHVLPLYYTSNEKRRVKQGETSDGRTNFLTKEERRQARIDIENALKNAPLPHFSRGASALNKVIFHSDWRQDADEI